MFKFTLKLCQNSSMSLLRHLLASINKNSRRLFVTFSASKRYVKILSLTEGFFLII